MRSLRKSGVQAPWRSARLAFRNVTALAFVGGVVYALPVSLGPGSLRDKALGLLASLGTAGHWVRSALVSAFQSIPVF